jgi:hypothetical protein
MGFVDDLAKMAGGTPAQKPFYAVNQYSVAISGHVRIQCGLLI